MPRAVGARTYRELTTWQLADELRRAVMAITASESALRDRRFCSSMRSAAGSVCHNLAEGFARRNDREFAQFIRIALGSLAEVSDHLHEATQRQLLTIDHFTRLEHLVDHVKASGTKLLRSLNTNPARRRRA
jgi:four helix bundle protein